MSEESPAADWDGPWKDALGNLLQWFLAMFFAQAHAEIDWSRGFEALDKELLKIAPAAATGNKTVDLPFKVWLRSGEERWVLIHVEVQAQRDADFPERVFVYNYRIADYYARPVASFAVLADDEPGWRPGPFSRDLWGCRSEFSYPVVKLLDFASRVEELEKSDNPFAVVVLAHLKARETADDRGRRREWKVRLLKGLYNRGWEPKDVRELLKLIEWFLTLPREIDRLVYQEVEADEKEKKMPFVSNFERFAEEKGEARGLWKGIERALKIKLGADGQRLMDEVRQIRDIESLETVFDAIEIAVTVDDVRRVLEGLKAN